MRKFLTALGILSHIFCCYIPYFPFEKFFLFDNEKNEINVALIVFIVFAILTFLVYLVDAIVTLIKNNCLFSKIRLILVLISVPICLFVIGGGNIGFAIYSAYSVGLLIIQIISLFVKDTKKE